MTGPGLQIETCAVLEQLCVLIRQIALQGGEHAETRAQVDRLQRAISAAEPPFALQFFYDAVLRDREILVLDLDLFRRCQPVVGALARLQAQELVLDTVPSAVTLLTLGTMLHAAAHTGRATAARLEGVRLARLVRPALADSSVDEAALDVFLIQRLDCLCRDAAILAADATGAWDWDGGCAVAYGIERFLAVSIGAAGRVYETAPRPWTRARRIVGAALHVSAVLARLRASPLTQRAATHAMLALAVHGLFERGGGALHTAAQAAMPRLLATGLDEGSQPEPHRLRVCALVSEAAKADRTAVPSLPVVSLLHAALELERRRVPEDIALTLGTVDLQAWLAEALGHEIHAGWGRALLGALGIVPAGSYVLADGRLGIVIGPSDAGDPWRPRVLLGGQIVVPAQPLTLYSPLAMTPWAK